MMRTALLILTALLIATLIPRGGLAADPVLPPGDASPLLRLETGGPRSYVSALEFSPDGAHLYATGWDKLVQVWNLDGNGRFQSSAGAALRVPTGSGLYGGLNAMTLSADGEWLAAAGQGHTREMSGERQSGWVMPAGLLSDAARLDEGLIYVFHTPTRKCTILRGHRGPVQSLAFVGGSRGTPPELVSIAEERVEGSGNLSARVRFWSVAQRTELAELKAVPDVAGNGWVPLPKLQGFRPGLTAWSSGANPKQARVALAWGDDQFRVWDVETGQVASAKSNPNLLSVLPLPGAGPGRKLLTGAHAEVGVWTLPATAGGRLPMLKRQDFQAAQIDSVNGQSQNLPGAAVVIPAAGGRPAYAAFVVTRYLPDGRGEYRLVLASLTSPIKTVKEFPLTWSAAIRQTALAASPDGRQLAVAGNERNEIEIYSVENLIRGGAEKPKLQVLASTGLSFQKVAFVRSGERWGLKLTPTRRDGEDTAGDPLVMDVPGRQIGPAGDDWKPASAAPEGWSAESTSAGALTVRRPDQDPLELDLGDEQVTNAFAFCPASATCPVPLIAVASHLRGQPLLQVFRGDSGEALRWCSGHTEQVRGLAFSQDGRMLASVADDRTTAIWTMADLVEQTLDRHGRIPGLSIHQRGEKLIVTEVPSGSSFQTDDEVIAVVRAGETIGLRSPEAFYDFVHARRAGESVETTVRRGAGREVVSVKSEVRQAVDEVKPLFTLFIGPAPARGEWEWIGWHPLGNFDSRGDGVDRWLGWHFNTGEAEQPARFAEVGEYRDVFYRRDLLQSLIDAQKLVVQAVEADPEITVSYRYHDGRPVQNDYYACPQLANGLAELVAEVKGVPERRIRSFDVSLDGGDPLPLARGEGKEWTLDLSKIDWTRGRHRLAVRLKTDQREVTRPERIAYRPAPPSLQWDADWKGELKEPEVVVRATVQPSGEAFRVELVAQRPGQPEKAVLRVWNSKETLDINEKVQIEPGDNALEIVAWNAAVPEEERILETARAVKTVRGAPPPQAPQLALTDVLEVPARGEPGVLSADDGVYRTPHSKIRVRGKITAEANLDQATVQEGAGEARGMKTFQPGQTKEFAFDEEFSLKPGVQTFVLRSLVKDKPDEKRLTVRYEPPVPTIAAFSASGMPIRELPEAGRQDGTVFYAGYHEPSVTITADLESAGAAAGGLDHPYRTVLRINDQAIGEDQIKLDRGQPGRHRLTARAPLAGGRNTIVLTIENVWGAEPVSRTFDLSYLRPPEVLEVQAPAKVLAEPFELVGRIRSTLPLRTASIAVDDKDEVRNVSIVRGDEPDLWIVKADKIGLAEGEHRLRLVAANDDGAALTPAVHTIVVEKPLEQPPVLAIISPKVANDSLTADTDSIEIQYTVKSAVPATLSVRRRRDGESFEEVPAGIEDARTEGTARALRLGLLEGVNEIELTARNSGGFSEKQLLRVAFVPPAVTVRITSVGDLKPRFYNDGTGYLDKASPFGHTTIRGEVVSRKGHAPGSRIDARIWVNLFKLPTVPVRIDEKDPRIARFETEVVFNSEKSNKIEVEIFRAEGRIASEVGCMKTLVVDCDAPERRQELYVLLLGTGDLQKMRDRAHTELLEAALQARPLTKQRASVQEWTSEPFAQIHVHDALNAPPAAVQNQVRELVGRMQSNIRKGERGNPQAIVMIFFQGQITLEDDDFAFGTVDPRNPRARMITGRFLEESLSRSYGAHLIFLDLQQTKQSVQARDVWPRAPHLGILVTNWTGPADTQPDHVRLGPALEQILPRARMVRDLAVQINERYDLAAKEFPGQVETVRRLDDVYGLQIGSGGGGQ